MKTNKYAPALYYALSLLLPAGIIVAALMGLKIAPFGDNTLAISDGNALYLSFLSYVGRAVKGQEGILYSFEKGLGANLMDSWGWFLLNPTFALFALFDITQYMSAYTLVSTLNLCLCGFTMAVLLKDLYGCKLSNLIFSTAYALSGFLVANVFQMNFFTGAAALPLMVLGLRRILESRNPLIYILALAYSLMTNFYFGFMLCVASVLIFVAFLIADWNRIEHKKAVMVRYAISSLLAGALSAAVWLPALLALRGGRLDQSSLSAISFNENMPFLDMFSKLFIGANSPGELQNGLPNIFVGILPVYLGILFFMNPGIDRRRRAATAVLTVFYLVSFYIVVFNLAMHGGTVTNWFNYRDSFIFSFLLLMMAAEEWRHIADEPDRSLKRAALILTVGALAVFSKRFEYVGGGMVIIAFAILGVMYLAFRMHKKDPVKNPRRVFTLIVLVLVGVDLFLNYNFSVKNILAWSHTDSDYQATVMPVSTLVDAVKLSDRNFYRMEVGEQYSGTTGNDPMLYGYNGVGHGGSDDRDFVRTQLSTLGVHRFDMRNYYGRGVTAATDALLGLKYVISREDLVEEKGYEKLFTMEAWSLYKNPNALPVALVSDSDITSVETDFEDLFDNLNRTWSAMTGSERRVFVEETDVTFEPHNITMPGAITQREAADIVASRDASASESASGESASDSEASEEAEDPFTIKYGTKTIRPEQMNYIAFTWTADADGAYYSYNRSGMMDGRGSILPALNYEGCLRKGETVTRYLPMTGSMVTEYLLEEVAGRFRVARADAGALEALSAELLDRDASIEKLTDSRLRGTFTLEEGQRLLFTIPWDEGWTCRVDGREVAPDKALGLFMTVEAAPGRHSYELEFTPTGLKPALILSLLALLLLPGYLLMDRWWRRRSRDAR